MICRKEYKQSCLRVLAEQLNPTGKVYRWQVAEIAGIGDDYWSSIIGGDAILEEREDGNDRYSKLAGKLIDALLDKGIEPAYNKDFNPTFEDLSKSMTDYPVGIKVKILMRQARISRNEVAKMCGVCPQHITDYTMCRYVRDTGAKAAFYRVKERAMDKGFDPVFLTV